MAINVATARTTPSTTLPVYTAPAGQTARLVACSLLNIGGSSQNVTMQWRDVDASPPTTYNLLTAGQIRSKQTVFPLNRDLTLAPGDEFYASPDTGSTDVMVAFDEDVELLATTGHQISHTSTTPTDLVSAGTSGVRVAFLAVTNSASQAEPFNLRFKNSDAVSPQLTDTHICRQLYIPPGTIYFPLYGVLGLSAGDQLEAWGEGTTTTNLTATVTVEPQTSLRTTGYSLTSSMTQVASSTTGTRRISYLSVCNVGGVPEDFTFQLVDASRSNANTGIILEASVPTGVTHFPLTGDVAMNAGDVMRASSSGNSLRLLITEDLGG